MISALGAASAFCAALTSLHIASALIAIARLRRGANDTQWLSRGPAISLIRPARGLENCIEDTLASGFRLDYPNYELIFCVAERDDPVAPLIERLIAAHPNVRARLLIGDDRISTNPKLNNMVKGVRAANAEWLIFADSNVLMPSDYIQRTLSSWRPDTGLVCSPPAAIEPVDFWAEVEAGFINSYQARWQYVADAIGYGFAQGKTMLWRRVDLERIGGLEALAAEVAEDAAATKGVRSLGLRVRLTAPPFPQPLGRRSFGEVWRRQTRWAQLRRASFPQWYAAELLTGILPPLVAAGLAAALADLPVAGVLAAFALAWYGCEALLVRTAGWPLSMASPLAWLARDLLLPVLWLQAWVSDEFVWRGNAMRSRDEERPSLARMARQWLGRRAAS
jgi:ceramide glucosyltransferase